VRNEPESQTPPSSNLYEGIEWKRLNGYQVPIDDFICRRCQKTRRQPVLIKVSHSTSAAIAHLKKEHSIDQFGTNQKKRKAMGEYVCTQKDEKSLANHIAAKFDTHDFKALLYDWIVHDSVSFKQLESDRLRKLLIYLNKRCKAHIPSRVTVGRTIGRIYNRCAGVVTEQLVTAVSKINVSFDLWTSGNKLALLGLCIHYFNEQGTPVTSLLALPQQKGRHTGLRIADTVMDIITAYNLELRLGWFTTDNAASDGTAIAALVSGYSFIGDERWVRCCGHIFNLVGQEALLGHNNDVFSNYVEQMELEEQQLIYWRCEGPIGCLYNVVVWINRSP